MFTLQFFQILSFANQNSQSEIVSAATLSFHLIILTHHHPSIHNKCVLLSSINNSGRKKNERQIFFYFSFIIWGFSITHNLQKLFGRMLSIEMDHLHSVCLYSHNKITNNLNWLSFSSLFLLFYGPNLPHPKNNNNNQRVSMFLYLSTLTHRHHQSSLRIFSSLEMWKKVFHRKISSPRDTVESFFVRNVQKWWENCQRMFLFCLS